MQKNTLAYKENYIISKCKIVVLMLMLCAVPKALPNQTLKLKHKQHNLKSRFLAQKHIKANLEHKLVLHYVNLYAKCVQLPKLIERSKPYIEQIIIELDKRNLPRELALLPIIESAYRIKAVSKKGATGVWQISHATGKRYGLNIFTSPNDQDERYDITASTKAALSYLNFLYNKFDKNWLLALAAYNAGEGRISKAIAEYLKITGTNTVNHDYWQLILPLETQHYVPKFLALTIILNNPQLYKINLNQLNYYH